MANDELNLSAKERRDVDEHSPPSARVVHATVSKQGGDELERPTGSLFWSAVAAGIGIFVSVSASGALRRYVPDVPWREPIVSLGYPLGFLLVVLGRLQLFTEQTVVAVLPVARAPSRQNISRLLRLWGMVLGGNIVGTAAVSALAVFGEVQAPEILAGMTGVASHLHDESPAAILLRGIPAGFLIASVAWIRSATQDSGFAIVAVLTYCIALCGFTHVIAGLSEAFLLMWQGVASPFWVVFGFFLPALAGNLLGGTGLFAALAHAQVKEEL